MAGVRLVAYDGFFSPQVFLNLLIDNAFLCIVAVGMTFVILSGGIDLSVGSVIALTTMVSAALVEHAALEPVRWRSRWCCDRHRVRRAAWAVLIQRFRLQPFIVTLAGMFLARGLCYLISIESISITDADLHGARAGAHSGSGVGASISIGAVDRAAWCVAVGIALAHATEFGRTVYAIGGNEASAVLMGLPVARTDGAASTPSAASARRWPAWCSRSTCSRATACTPWAWSSTPSPPW